MSSGSGGPAHECLGQAHPVVALDGPHPGRELGGADRPAMATMKAEHEVLVALDP